MNSSDQWLEESEDNRKVYAQEGLILDVTESIWGVLEKRGWNKKTLADALGTSRAHVTQLLDGSRNMTLRTLSDIAFSLHMRVNVRLCDESATNAWEDAGPLTIIRQQSFGPLGDVQSITAANDWVSLSPAEGRKSA
ncbi:helix-turn-helix domain-containing protein [Acidiferrobacter thiooxydans]|uniref:helix-turn-helix domain-containing protein n=1 Tax=Acidiferrobacter thiooxydans TaxID=163359 RepID=UPI000DF49891|nr:helix-turn-helix transcriptional regulator [Acidiferrobacter thiooxydans]